MGTNHGGVNFGRRSPPIGGQFSTLNNTLPDTCDLSALPISTETQNIFLVQADDDAGTDAWQALRTAHADSSVQLHRITTDSTGLDGLLQGQDKQALQNTLQPVHDAIAAPAVIAALDRLHSDWTAHVARATTAHAHPCYVIGHAELVERLRELRDQAAVAALPAAELSQLDALLAQARRQDRALSHVKNYLAKLEPCRAQLRDLHDLAVPDGSQIQDLPAYKAWRSSADQLLEQGNAIASDHNTYGACLNHTFQAWNDLHSGIRKLQQDLGHDTSSLRHQQPDLYLRPITRPVPTLDDAKEADASYRRLRDDWNDHMARAEARHAHPYEIDGYAPLIDTIQQLPDRAHLDATARDALRPLLVEHAHVEQARTDIDAYLNDTQRAFRSLTNLKDVAERFKPQGIELKDIGSYTDWRERALGLASAGKDILADRQHYRIHLKQNPELTGRIHATVQDLNAAIRSEEASIKPQEQEQAAQKEQTARDRRQIKP